MPRTKYRNKDYSRGLLNRQRGIFKKANTCYRWYGGQVGVVIKQNGRTIKYESHHGVLEDCWAEVTDAYFGPDDFDTVADRQRPPGANTGPANMTIGSDSNKASPHTPLSTPDKGSPISSSGSSRIEPSDTSDTSDTSDMSDLHSLFSLSPPMAFPLEQTVDLDAYPDSSEPKKAGTYIFPSALLPMPPSYQTKNLTVPDAPSGSEKGKTSQSAIFAPKAISPRRKEALLSLVKEYFGD
ncbi:hypothetical protein MGN70_009407 [Eutypa lata]|nr:hypothetical protein MGN70_009407 [Eutypa lata]